MALTTAHFHSGITPSLPSPFALTFDRHPRSKDRISSTTFNHGVEMEIHPELAHTLISHEKPSCVKFSQDGRFIAVGCSGGEAHIFEVESGTLTRILRNLLSHEEEPIEAVSFSRDGKYLATGSSDGDISIWEITTKFVRNTFQGHIHEILSLAFSPDDRLLVSTSGDNTVRLWNMHDGTGTLLSENSPTFLDYPYHTSAVFSPDGKFLATSHRDGIVRIWGVRTNRLLRRVHAHRECVYDIAFTPNGRGLISGSADRTLKYWDVSSLNTTTHSQARSQTNGLQKDPSGVEVQTRSEREFLGHGGYVHSLAISPDARWVASGSPDKTVRLWDSRKAVLQCTLNLDDQVSGVDFSPKGCYLASGESDGTIRIWKY